MYTPSYPTIVFATVSALITISIICIVYYLTSTSVLTRRVNNASCAVIIGEHPDASNPGRTVCFDVGRFPKVSIPFPPRFIRVAAGYKLIAFSQRQYGEPVRYRMEGPAERFIRCDDADDANKINSIIVTLGVTTVIKVDECQALLRMGDGTENCINEATPIPALSDVPVVAVDVQEGYRLVAMSQRHFGGERVADYTGPMEKNVVTSRARAPWASVRVQHCALTLYSAPNLAGARRCMNGDTESIPPFMPMSFALAAGTKLRVYSDKNYKGDVVFEASGPRAADCPRATIRMWGSLKLEAF
jgi:hypothetical protein